MPHYFHISAAPYLIGQEVPGNGRDKIDPRIEDALEATKPDGMLSRRDAVYFRPGPDFSVCGIVNAGYIYAVEPVGNVQKHDLMWIGEMQKALLKEKYPDRAYFQCYPDWDDALIEKCCDAYWKGTASDSPVWEYLSPSFTVAEILSDKPVIASATKGGWTPA